MVLLAEVNEREAREQYIRCRERCMEKAKQLYVKVERGRMKGLVQERI